MKPSRDTGDYIDRYRYLYAYNEPAYEGHDTGFDWRRAFISGFL